MLVLTRKHRESIHIGNDILITIVRVKGDRVRIGIQAPKEVRIMRSELLGTLPKSELQQSQAKSENSGKFDAGPLHAFLNASPKVALATAS